MIKVTTAGVQNSAIIQIKETTESDKSTSCLKRSLIIPEPGGINETI